MRNTANSLDKHDFIIGQIFCSYIALILCLFNFRRIDGLSYYMSLAVCNMIFVLCSVAGCAVEYHDRRNRLFLSLNTISAAGIYVAVSFFTVMRKLELCLAIIAVVTAVICWKFCFNKRITGIRMRNYIILMHLVISLLLVVVIFASILMRISIKASYFNDSDIVPAGSNEAVVEENADLIRTTISRWDSMDINGRVEALKEIVRDIETESLEIPYSPIVRSGKMDDTINGYYSNEFHEIVISRRLIKEDSAQENISTLLHEMYHAYEDYLVNGHRFSASDRKTALYRNMLDYKKEFENYIPSTTDEYVYYNQHCERDARHYSYIQMKRYMRAIEQIKKVY